MSVVSGLNRLAVVIGVGVLAMGARPAIAEFQIISVTDSVSGPVSPAAHVSINDHGVVALFGHMSGELGVYTIDGGQVKTITTDLGNGIASTSINDHGVVAYSASDSTNNAVVGVGDGVSPTQIIIDESSSLLTCAGGGACLYGASINDHGVVAFVGNGQGNRSVFTYDAGVFASTADDVGPMLEIGDTTDINNNGVVAYAAVPAVSGEVGLFTFSGGVVTEVVSPTSPDFDGFGFFGGNPSINVTGNVASNAIFDDGTSGVVILDGGAASGFIKIADDSGEASFAILRAASINDRGLVVFRADLDSGGRGIFIADQTGVTKVIATGDALFGSTVGSGSFDLDMTNFALNNNNELAFQYVLTDGTRGVAIASVPEPGTVGLLVAGVGGLGVVRRRRAI